MKDEAGRQARPATRSALAADDSRASGSHPWWTAADEVEWSLLVDEFVRGYFSHRESCASCRRDRCPAATAYGAHKASCWPCQNSIRFETPSFGPPCPAYAAHLAHVYGCAACCPEPCPALGSALEVVLDWRRRRELESLAVRLRARQDIDDWKAA